VLLNSCGAYLQMEQDVMVEGSGIIQDKGKGIPSDDNY